MRTIPGAPKGIFTFTSSLHSGTGTFLHKLGPSRTKGQKPRTHKGSGPSQPCAAASGSFAIKEKDKRADSCTGSSIETSGQGQSEPETVGQPLSHAEGRPRPSTGRDRIDLEVPASYTSPSWAHSSRTPLGAGIAFLPSRPSCSSSNYLDSPINHQNRGRREFRCG